jgi:succinylarginine dihydrolase
LLNTRSLVRGAAGGGPPRQARPREAALAVLDLCRALVAHGKPVAVLPPPERPNLALLRTCGFSGDDQAVIDAASRDPGPAWHLATDATTLWTADMATALPLTDAPDRRLHLVVANLGAFPHRQPDTANRVAQLRALFPDTERVAIHPPTPALPALWDAGASNHHRAATGGGRCHLLAYGSHRAIEAARRVARCAGLVDALPVPLHPGLANAGAHHLDQVATGARDRLLVHEHAFDHQPEVLDELRRRVPGVRTATVSANELPLPEAIRCGLLTSLLLRTPQGHVLLAPAACSEGAPRRTINRLLGEGFITGAGFISLGADLEAGGVAPLRLRVPLAAADLRLVHPGVLVDARKLDTLGEWAKSCYRETLEPHELADPVAIAEARHALDLLTRLLGLGSRSGAFQALG